MVMRVVLSSIVVLLAIGGALADACPTATNSTCNYDILRCCDDQFQKTLGLSNCTGAFYDEPECHQKDIENLYAGGTQNLLKVCSAFNTFYQCLGKSSSDCTSIQFHMNHGMDLGSAMQLVSIYKQYGFACGAGLDAFVNADKCMSGVFTKNTTAAKIASCRNEFGSNLRSQWAEHCSYFQEFTGCFQKTFRDSCVIEGSGLEAGWWGCEYARQGARSNMHDCYVQCSATLKMGQPAKSAMQFNSKLFESPKKNI